MVVVAVMVVVLLLLVLVLVLLLLVVVGHLSPSRRRNHFRPVHAQSLLPTPRGEEEAACAED